MESILIAFLSVLPQDTDIHKFPKWNISYQQEQICKESLPKLMAIRDVRGWGSTGQWHSLVEEVEFHKKYWNQLEKCHSNKDDILIRVELQKLKELIGPERYFHKWSPPLYSSFPDDS